MSDQDILRILWLDALFKNHDGLTKTEAITPTITQREEDFRSELIDVYCCGNCGQELEQYPRKWNYCPICGKAVKWYD